MGDHRFKVMRFEFSDGKGHLEHFQNLHHLAMKHGFPYHYAKKLLREGYYIREVDFYPFEITPQHVGSQGESAPRASRPQFQLSGREVEISDGVNFKETFPNLNQAAKACGFPSASTLYLAIDGKGYSKRRSDEKVFYVRGAGRMRGPCSLGPWPAPEA